MTTSFDRWEKDPFFSAAEEVQDSADRMESTYRTWIHAKKDTSSMWDPEELQRDLRTTLGTTKWQLDEFVRAVRSSYVKSSNDDAVDRHREFIVAIESLISNVEKSLQKSSLLEGKVPLSWVRLDEGERDELALFLAGTPTPEVKNTAKNCGRGGDKQLGSETKPPLECSKSSTRSVELGPRERRQEKEAETVKVHGHRRTASACADIGVWKITVSDDDLTSSSSDRLPVQPVRKIPSLSGFLSSMDCTTSKANLPKNGFRKWKAMDIHKDTDSALLRPTELTKGINACYERNKSCLDSCDECYDKELHGWYGAIQRQFQRSQYQMQYSRPVQMTIWITILLCLFVLVTLSIV